MTSEDKTQPIPIMKARCFQCGELKPVTEMRMNIPLWRGNINVNICFECLEKDDRDIPNINKRWRWSWRSLSAWRKK